MQIFMQNKNVLSMVLKSVCENPDRLAHLLLKRSENQLRQQSTRMAEVYLSLLVEEKSYQLKKEPD
jgi:hypothetical protein